MSDPMDTIRDIVYPGITAPVTPIRHDPLDAHGDDIQATTDGDWTPDPKDVC